MWQQRLHAMELELQSNKQHIQQLMQQLHALAAKQVSFRQAADPDTALPSARSQCTPSMQLRSRVAAASAAPSTSSSGSHSSSSVSSSMHADSSFRSDQQDDATSQETTQQVPAPFADATNRVARNSSRWQQQDSSTMHGYSPAGNFKGLSCGNASATGAENSPPNADLQEDQALPQQQKQQEQGKQPEQAALDQQPSLQRSQQQQEQQELQDSSQYVEVQRQYQELQQRTKQLEAENAQLKSAQAVAAAQIDTMRLAQQAESLKQVCGAVLQ